MIRTIIQPILAMFKHRKLRHITFNPQITYFKPIGIPLHQLEEITLHPDEIQALKLHDVDGLDQTTAAEKMHI